MRRVREVAELGEGDLAPELPQPAARYSDQPPGRQRFGCTDESAPDLLDELDPARGDAHDSQRDRRRSSTSR